MKTIIYTRVSHQEQAKNGLSLENQLDRCRKYCAFKEFDIIGEICDEGVSGFKTSGRKGWEEMMGLVESKKIDAVVCYSLSRFARNTAATILAIEKMNKKGVEFHSITESIDTNSATGKLFLTMIAAFAEFERTMTGERIKSVLDMKKKKGEAMGSVSYGYKREGKMLVEDETEQGIIRYIVELKERGMNLRGIAEQLEDLGLKTRTGNKWHVQQIKNIIENQKVKI